MAPDGSQPSPQQEVKKTSTLEQIKTRGYQEEMLEESKAQNIIIALDTGSGKTHIAVLRMKAEVEQETNKVCWFLAPTVTLCNQQHRVINSSLPVTVGLISGALQPDQWKDKDMWRRTLKDHKIIVSTPQVLLDALRHGYVDLGKKVSLLVFDEAHHAVDKHPYNRIMVEFYQFLPVEVRPKVLGLTASPIYGGDIIKAFNTIEANLDSKIRTPKLHEEELSSVVHKPTFKQVQYPPGDKTYSSNLQSLDYIVGQLNIEDDPYVKSLRAQLAAPRLDPVKRKRQDQKLSKTILNQDSYTHKGLRDFVSAAQCICEDIGPWAADWFVEFVIQKAMKSARPFDNAILNITDSEKAYLLSILEQVRRTPVSFNPDDVARGCSSKLETLIDCLLAEKGAFETLNEAYSGLVFVQRRDVVVALTEVLNNHPRSKGTFRVGSLIGSSDSAFRKSFLDITRALMKRSEDETLDDFRIGEINLVVATSVAEEGVDIQACCHVTRWDPPPNMASWIQSRGRARRKRSTFTLLMEKGSVSNKDIETWKAKEQEMVSLYNNARSEALRRAQLGNSDDEDGETLEFRIESTGAVLTLHSAVSHLEHFCAVIPSNSYTSYRPLYDLDPPDLPEGWHSQNPRHVPVYLGPWGSTITLPRLLPPELREFTAPTIYGTKSSAHKHAAFLAYRELYTQGLLNDHLMPFTSVTEPFLDDVVKDLLKDVEKRASTAKVSLQMNPFVPTTDNGVWWLSELEIEGENTLLILTPNKPSTWTWENPVMIHRPHNPPTMVTLRPISEFRLADDEDTVTRARLYTRRLFWTLYGAKMEWGELDFTYLILPPKSENEEAEWLLQFDLESEILEAGDCSKDAQEFGEEFVYPDDIALVATFQKVFRFVRWHFDPLSPEEEDILRETKYFPEYEFTYPLLVVEDIRRTNYLIPLPQADDPASKTQANLQREPRLMYIHPSFTRVILASETEASTAMIMPSILRALYMSMTAESLRQQLFQGPYECLSSIPSDLLLTAITASSAGEPQNYQRLETLGDTVLKLVVTIQLLAEYPLWHEGYLAKKKDHAVSNSRLAKEAIRLKLYRWIIRDRYKGKKWKPEMLAGSHSTSIEESADDNAPVDEELEGVKTKRKGKQTQQLSRKVLADVIESILGAAYLTGSFTLSLECAKMFDLGLIWRNIPERVEQMRDRAPKLEPGQVLPPQLEYVEQMLGYEFKNKLLLQEALTHGSHHPSAQAADTISYERMEFLGDAVIDMIVTEYLYHAKPSSGKPYSPGHMFLRKSALVNGHLLAYICLRQSHDITVGMPQSSGRNPYNPQISLNEKTQRIYLYQCLLHSSSYILDMQRDVKARFQHVHERIEQVLFGDKAGMIFPWADLTSLQAPKLFSDIVESLIGAVYLDSHGNLDVVTSVLRKLGWMEIMERIVDQEIDVQHPVSRLHLWASLKGKKAAWKYEEEDGEIRCMILIDGKEMMCESQTYRGQASKGEVKFRAAEKFNWKYTLDDLVDLNQVSHAAMKRVRRAAVDERQGARSEK